MFKERTEKAKEKLIDPDSSDEDSIIPCEQESLFFFSITPTDTHKHAHARTHTLNSHIK